MKIFKKMMVLLDKKQKRTMVLLLFLMLIGALLEASGITLVVPVISVVLTPEEGATGIAAFVYGLNPFESTRVFGIAIMIALILVFVIKNIYLYFEQKAIYSFVYTNQFKTSERMMKNYMRRSYEFYLNADSAVIQRSITSDVNNMYALILSVLTLVSEVIMFVAISVVLVVADPILTCALASLLIVTLIIIKIWIKPIMYKAGKDNQDYYSSLFKWISQTVTGIKDVKVAGREKYFIDEYNKCGTGYVNAVQKYTLFNNIPRLIIETVCVAGVVAYFMFLFLRGADISKSMSILTAFGLAIVRLMPSANRINNQLNSISYFEPFFMNVSDNLQDEIDDKNVDVSFMDVPSEKLPITKEIVMEGVSYKYPNTDNWILKDANMSIPVGSAVGIVGQTGAGKSTIVDVMLGMLGLHEGKITADGVDVMDPANYRRWLKNIGYIPQTIFMLDDDILHNIAFGVPEEEINEERVWEVLREAQLDEFVKSLPEGLKTGIGERGIRLSGGQRQRISIARALYDDPEVLVLDEATSALDNDTEKAIMDSINRLHGSKTLIIIAHRLQTIEKCDAVYRIENTKATRER